MATRAVVHEHTCDRCGDTWQTRIDRDKPLKERILAEKGMPRLVRFPESYTDSDLTWEVCTWCYSLIRFPEREVK